MSSIIPQAAAKRIIMPHADFLIHDGTLELSGGYQSVCSEVVWSQTLTEVMLDIYVRRCKHGPFFKQSKMDDNEVRGWLRAQIDKKQEVYMTAVDAVDKGFMDGIFGAEGLKTVEDLYKLL